MIFRVFVCVFVRFRVRLRVRLLRDPAKPE
jgi:hypothetical protein